MTMSIESKRAQFRVLRARRQQCTASRSALMTGRFAVRSGTHSVQAARNRAAASRGWCQRLLSLPAGQAHRIPSSRFVARQADLFPVGLEQNIRQNRDCSQLSNQIRLTDRNFP
jgi:hypothetical protein